MYIRGEWFGIVNRQILSILAELSAGYMFVFLFPGDNLRKHQSIFTKLGICIDIIEIWFGIDHFLTEICPPYDSGGILSFHVFIFFCSHNYIFVWYVLVAWLH